MRTIPNKIIIGFLLVAGILSFSLRAQQISRPEIDTLCQQLLQAKNVGLKKYRLDLNAAESNQEEGALRKRALELYYLQVMPKDGKGLQNQLFLAEVSERSNRSGDRSLQTYFFHPDGYLMLAKSVRSDKSCAVESWYYYRGDLIEVRKENGKSCDEVQLKSVAADADGFSQEDIFQSLEVLGQSGTIQDLFQSLAALKF